jgi:hypothetical protein
MCICFQFLECVRRWLIRPILARTYFATRSSHVRKRLGWHITDCVSCFTSSTTDLCVLHSGFFFRPGACFNLIPPDRAVFCGGFPRRYMYLKVLQRVFKGVFKSFFRPTRRTFCIYDCDTLVNTLPAATDGRCVEIA